MKKIIMVVLDGFGLNDNKVGNAVKLASTPTFDRLYAEYPHSELIASGEEVGLPKGQMGNSEVGHITLGSARTVKQPLSIINDKIKNKKFFESEELINIMNHVNENDSSLHIIGLLSNGGVHSSITHFYALLALAKLKKVKKVYFHFITDGRDVSPTSGKKFIKEFESKMKKVGVGIIASLCGRYYAMDRDKRWDRTKKAYDLLVYGKANKFVDATTCIEKHYHNGVTDEFVNPSIIDQTRIIDDNDGIIFANFRSERMKQLIETFKNDKFTEFETKKFNNLKMASIFNIYNNLDFGFKLEEVKNSFGEYIESLDYKQARVAETEKYAHVTHFFDGDRDLNLKNCSKYLIPSPKVSTYDMKPDMSIGEVTKTVLSIMEDDYDFILVNFANPDMVGHTGNLKAAVEAVEVCDICLERIVEKSNETFYDVVITADHGNAEYMLDKNNNIITSHTTNKVQFILCNSKYKLNKEGTLKDVVPTIIEMFEISKPKEMTGKSLIKSE